MQIAEYVDGRRRIVAHLGSAHSEAELGLLLERARRVLEDPGQGEFDLGVEPTPRKAGLLTRDPRMKERKKYGLHGARRGTQFSKR